ncbi:MAG: RNA methyltransferase [Rhodobacteraceae bacterium]|nr:RNA methyltransferase [Paracoccaceae bacterium]
MAGTRTNKQPETTPAPAFILVEPQLGENIGAAARAMWNFGLEELRLVAPRDGWPSERAVAMASGATRVLDQARVFTATAEAAADLSYIYATTARPRELTKLVMTPEAAAFDALARIGRGERVGVLFGRERTGLENHDVIAANAIVTVPANPAFASLNLAQCVLLMGYELRRAHLAATDPRPKQLYETGDGAMATREGIDGLYDHLVGELDQVNYFWPEHKREAMAASLRNLLSRAPLTDQDVRMLRGVVRALAEKPRQRG